MSNLDFRHRPDASSFAFDILQIMYGELSAALLRERPAVADFVFDRVERCVEDTLVRLNTLLSDGEAIDPVALDVGARLFRVLEAAHTNQRLPLAA